VGQGTQIIANQSEVYNDPRRGRYIKKTGHRGQCLPNPSVLSSGNVSGMLCYCDVNACCIFNAMGAEIIQISQ
jgi:hypothetical protein